MASDKHYVAGWLDTSVRDFLAVLPRSAASMQYALITCLDSNIEPRSLLRSSAAIRAIGKSVKPLGKGLLLPMPALVVARKELLFGFDEGWFFPSKPIKPKPHFAWLVGPARINQEKLDKLGTWMSDNSCSLALGDGEGLNFIVKAHGLVKYLLGHSIEQPQPNCTFVSSPTAAVAG